MQVTKDLKTVEIPDLNRMSTEEAIAWYTKTVVDLFRIPLEEQCEANLLDFKERLNQRILLQKELEMMKVGEVKEYRLGSQGQLCSVERKGERFEYSSDSSEPVVFMTEAEGMAKYLLQRTHNQTIHLEESEWEMELE